MNHKMMGRLMAQILTIESLFMLPALCISLYCGEAAAVRGFVYTLALMLVLELLLFLLCRKAPDGFYAKEGFLHDDGAVIYSAFSALFLTSSPGDYVIAAHLPAISSEE